MSNKWTDRDQDLWRIFTTCLISFKQHGWLKDREVTKIINVLQKNIDKV